MFNKVVFLQRHDATERIGFNELQKRTAVMLMLAYGCCAGSLDAYTPTGESTAIKYLKEFSKSVNDKFGSGYLQSATTNKTKTLFERSLVLGFCGKLGSIDWYKWFWKNFHTAFRGQRKGKEKVPAVTMKAILNDQLQCWHMFFGVAGCNNDLSLGWDITIAIDGCTLSTGFGTLIFAGWHERKGENSMA